MQIMTEKEILNGGEQGKAKILLMGPSKSGKTVSAANTSPPPVCVINAEPGGLASAAGLGGKFSFLDIRGYDEFGAAMQTIWDNLEAKGAKGKAPSFRTIVLDSITALADDIEEECRRKYTGFDVYSQFKAKLLWGVMKDLLALPTHVVVIAHAIQGGKDNGDLGILPAIAGKPAARIPAMLHDSLWLQVTPGKDGEEVKREFLLGAQGNWIHSGRHISRAGRIDANITKFLEYAHIKP